MNFDKLVKALLERGFNPDRANEIAQWYFSPPGTPYPEFSSRLAICNSAKWDESKHKRDNSGRFSSTGGGGNPHSDDPEWRRIGQQAPSSVHTSKIDRLRKKIADDAEFGRLMEKAGLYPTSDQKAKQEAIDFRRKRQEAELVREEKHKQRLAREDELDYQHKRVDELVEDLDDDETPPRERKRIRNYLKKRGIDNDSYDYYRWTDTGVEAREARINSLQREFDHMQTEQQRWQGLSITHKDPKMRKRYARRAQQADSELDAIEREIKELESIRDSKK